MSELFLHATLNIRLGGYERFCESMAKQVPVLENLGWKLAGAYVTSVGRVYTVIDVWEIPDANSFFTATEEWRKTPEYQDFKAVTAEVVEEEVLTMVKKVPYSP